MPQITTHDKIVSFIWGIADDTLRDLFKRGKCLDVILPVCGIRRMPSLPAKCPHAAQRGSTPWWRLRYK